VAVRIANVPALTQAVTEAPLHDINPTLCGSIVCSSHAGRHLLIASLVDSSIKAAGSLVTVKAFWLMSWVTGSWKVQLPSEPQPQWRKGEAHPIRDDVIGT
jgi:hypothetical protein